MRKILSMLLAVALIGAALTGCAGAAETAAAASSVTPSASAPAIATTPPDTTPTPAPGSDENAGAVTKDGWTYYLDENDAAVVNYGEDPPLHRENADGSDEDLDIRGFGFDIIGESIYVDSNYPYLDENGNQTWYTTIMGLDGSNKRRLEYGSMSARLIPDGEQKFYFTTAGDSAVYVSDFSCQDVTPLIVSLPDESELQKKLGDDTELQMDIDEVADGKISFDVTFLTAEGIQMYNGSYTMAEDGTGIEKVKGTYYDYESLESELD